MNDNQERLLRDIVLDTEKVPDASLKGIDVLAGSNVSDDYLLTSSIKAGLSRRELKGVDPVVWIFERK